MLTISNYYLRAKFMDESLFTKKVYKSINENRLINELFSTENGLYRARLLFKIINTLCKILNYFDLQNDIIFENKIPFIKIDKIKLMVCNHYYLKHTRKKLSSSFVNIEKFLETLKLKPSYIVDLGSCWGACSLHLASTFQDAKIFCIEGSLNNYNIFKINLLHNSKYNSNIYSNHLIISNKSGFEEISNDLSTMNVVKKIND